MRSSDMIGVPEEEGALASTGDECEGWSDEDDLEDLFELLDAKDLRCLM